LPLLATHIMTEQAIHTTKLQISQDNLPIDAYLAKPKSSGSYPGIVVLQEILALMCIFGMLQSGLLN
jgi:hypothetical protein